jgi:hypothetical protein
MDSGIESILEMNQAEPKLENESEEKLGKPTSAGTAAKQAGQVAYERKSSESMYSEELEFHQYRKKKLESMDKKSKHLLLFSNINQLNFADINK